MEMNIETAVAYAIQEDFDILAAFPKLIEIGLEKMDRVAEVMVTAIHRQMTEVIQRDCMAMVESRDAQSLCNSLKEKGVKIPHWMLLGMCNTIVENYGMTTLGTPVPCGINLYYMKITIDLSKPLCNQTGK